MRQLAWEPLRSPQHQMAGVQLEAQARCLRYRHGSSSPSRDLSKHSQSYPCVPPDVPSQMACPCHHVIILLPRLLDKQRHHPAAVELSSGASTCACQALLRSCLETSSCALLKVADCHLVSYASSGNPLACMACTIHPSAALTLLEGPVFSHDLIT